MGWIHCQACSIRIAWHREIEGRETCHYCDLIQRAALKPDARRSRFWGTVSRHPIFVTLENAAQCLFMCAGAEIEWKQDWREGYRRETIMATKMLTLANADT